MNHTGPNSKCPCSSGLKYKYCCANRDKWSLALPDPAKLNDTDRHIQGLLNRLHCYHPLSPEDCDGKIVHAHTISKSGNLLPIAVDGFVVGLKRTNIYEMIRDGGEVPFVKINISRASTFRGFCAKHDKLLFRCVEDEPFCGSQRQVATLMFRTLCRELRGKEAISATRKTMDIAFPSPASESRMAYRAHNYFNLNYEKTDLSAQVALRDLTEAKRRLSLAIEGDSSVKIRTIALEASSKLPYAAAGMCTPSFSPKGTRIQNLNDPRIFAGMLYFHTVLLSPERTTLLLSWDDVFDEVLLPLVSEFLDDSVAGWYEVFCFMISNVENVFYSPVWFESLDTNLRKLLRTMSIHPSGPGKVNRVPRVLRDAPCLPVPLFAKFHSS